MHAVGTCTLDRPRKDAWVGSRPCFRLGLGVWSESPGVLETNS